MCISELNKRESFKMYYVKHEGFVDASLEFCYSVLMFQIKHIAVE